MLTWWCIFVKHCGFFK